MKAVFKHELSSYFTSLSAYVFSAFLLLFAGIYTMAYNIQGGLADFQYVLSAMAFVFLIIVPIITMRVISEERRQKTDQLLYALPLTTTKVVLGKYAAMLVMFCVPLCIICIYPIILSAYGNVYLPEAYGAVIGFFFLGSSLMSIGIFISSLTESQAVAAGLCFVVVLLNYFLASLADLVSSTAFASFAALTAAIILLALVFYLMTKSGAVSGALFVLLEVVLYVFYTFSQESFEGLFPDIMKSLSLFARFENFVSGVFDLTAIVFYISVTAVFLFLTIMSMEKRRWGE